MQVVVSNDGENTFGAPKFITAVNTYAEPGIRSGGFLPSAIADRAGNLYVVYQARIAGAPRILFTKSSNAGDTWTAPVVISNNPAGLGVFNPAVAASPDGQKVSVAFYDHRNNPGSNTLVDMYLAGRLSLGQINNPVTGGEAGDADRDGEQNKSEFTHGTDPNNATSVFHTARQLNISTRTSVEPGDENALIGGFIITGTAPKQVIVRALGPSLTARRVPGALQNPTLELVPESGPRVFNNDWRDSDATAIQATGIPPDDDREAAIVQILPPGGHTAIVRGLNNSTGVGLAEVYDLNPAASPKLGNISSRGFVGVNDNVMIGGLIVGDGEGTNGAGSVRLLVRGIGPSLAARGVTGPLQNPELLLYNSNGVVLATNDNWREAQEAAINATGIAPEDDREAAILTTLGKGNYTAILRGNSGATGVGLVESYVVQ